MSGCDTPLPLRAHALNFARALPIRRLPAGAGRSVKMALLAWNDNYSVGVNTIDQQHSGLFDIVNELHAAMMKGQAKNVLGALLDRLIKYTVLHFSYEERMMEAAKYPNLAAHRARHTDLTRQVKEFSARYKKGDANLNVELIRFLSDWLTRHILHEDKQYSSCLNQIGVK
jgi:hemerythrin-like metal-binding protein